MGQILKGCRKNAQEKVKSIQDISNKLCNTEALSKWGVEISNKAIELETQILPAPRLALTNGEHQDYFPDCLRKLPVQKGKKFTAGNWICAYASSNYASAEQVTTMLMKASGQLNVKVEEPYWIEIDREDNYDQLY